MEFERLIYTNSDNESIEFSVYSPYYVNFHDVTGLNDVSGQISTSSSFNQNGETFLSSKVNSRDIELKGVINNTDKDETFSLRREMNRILNPDLSGKLKYIYKDNVKVIEAHVISAPKISKGPLWSEFLVQIECPTVFFEDENETITSNNKYIKAFKFPIAIEENNMVFGTKIENDIADIVNLGDTDVGFIMNIKVSQPFQGIRIMNIYTLESLIIPDYSFSANDIIIVNTNYGEKTIIKGTGELLFPYLDIANSQFFSLHKGINSISVEPIKNIAPNPIPPAPDFEVIFKNKFLGV